MATIVAHFAGDGNNAALLGEIAGRGADPAVQAGGDVVLEHLPGPSVGGVTGGVPVSQCRVVELVEQGPNVPPRQFLALPI
jgi:hypothetical protein